MFEGLDNAYPLTPLQQGMLYEGLKNPNSNIYVAYIAIDITAGEKERRTLQTLFTTPSKVGEIAFTLRAICHALIIVTMVEVAGMREYLMHIFCSYVTVVLGGFLAAIHLDNARK